MDKKKIVKLALELAKTLAVVALVGAIIYFVTNSRQGDTEKRMKKLIEDNRQNILDAFNDDARYNAELSLLKSEIEKLVKENGNLTKAAELIKEDLKKNLDIIKKLRNLADENAKKIRERLTNDEFEQNIKDYKRMVGNVAIFPKLEIDKISRRGIGIHEGQLRLTNNLFNLSELQKQGILKQGELLTNYGTHISNLKVQVEKQNISLGKWDKRHRSLYDTLKTTDGNLNALSQSIDKMKKNWFWKKTLPALVVVSLISLLSK